MNFVSLPADLMSATQDTSDPLRRYAALMVCWSLHPMDVACRDLLVPGGKNSLPVPSENDWDIVLDHKERFENAITPVSLNA